MRLGALQCRVAGGGGEPELKEGILGTEGEVLGGGWGGVGVCSRARTRGGVVVWCGVVIRLLIWQKGMGTRAPSPV